MFNRIWPKSANVSWRFQDVPPWSRITVVSSKVFDSRLELILDLMADRMIYRHGADLFWDNFPNITSLKIRTHHCPLLTVMETISKKYPKMEKFHFYSYNVPDGDRADEKVWGITKQSLDSLENAAKFLNLKELYVEFDPKFYDHFDFDPDFPEDLNM